MESVAREVGVGTVPGNGGSADIRGQKCRRQYMSQVMTGRLTIEQLVMLLLMSKGQLTEVTLVAARTTHLKAHRQPVTDDTEK